jgi:DNA-binding transcriptional ArsR family regulator
VVDTLELLLHPVRVRIVHAMSGGQICTTSDLCARLPDVPKTSLYRHVGLLAEAGMLEVAGEQRVHGAVERKYRLCQERAVIGPDAAASMSLEDHRTGFAAAMAALLAEFSAYLDREHADPTADLVGYRQIPLWLNQDELADLISRIRSIIVSKMGNEPAPDRRPYLLSPILFPTAEPAQDRPAGPPSPVSPGTSGGAAVQDAGDGMGGARTDEGADHSIAGVVDTGMDP